MFSSERLDPLPTQLYVSVDAPNKEIFDKVCKPKWNSRAWEQFEKTIDLLPSLDTRIVARHTLMKGINMSDKNIREFAALDNRADPDFIENKGYVFVGHSRENLSAENMPSHDDIMEFSAKIAPLTGRKILSDSKPSRVALVGRQITPIPIPEPTMFFPDDLGIAPPVKHLPIVQQAEIEPHHLQHATVDISSCTKGIHCCLDFVPANRGCWSNFAHQTIAYHDWQTA